MRKFLTTLTFVFFCAATLAQENTLVMSIYYNSGDKFQFLAEHVDTMTFTTESDTLLLRSKDGNVWGFAVSLLDSIAFTHAPITNVHEVVDMGLSAMWATTNVGAAEPEGLGGRFAWGETSEKRRYDESNYKFFTNEQYENIGVNICGTKYDVARLQWGDAWRMPTRSEIRELTTQCKWTAETRNGVYGFRVTAPNGNHIFLPATGYQNGTTPSGVGEEGFYWSGSLDRNILSAAYNLNFRGYDSEWTANRSYGMSVRPVK